MRYPACRSHAIIAVALLALSLAGCSKKEAGAGGSAETGKLAAAGDGAMVKALTGDVEPRAGEWESHIRIDKVEMTNMPPQMQAMMDSNKGKERVATSCLTQEQVKAAKGAMFKQTAPGCKFESFAMAGGHLDAKLHCVNEMGNRVTTMSGTYGAEAYAMQVTNTGQMGQGQNISTAMTITAKRTGECTAASKAKAARIQGSVMPEGAQ